MKYPFLLLLLFLTIESFSQEKFTKELSIEIERLLAELPPLKNGK